MSLSRKVSDIINKYLMVMKKLRTLTFKKYEISVNQTLLGLYFTQQISDSLPWPAIVYIIITITKLSNLIGYQLP